MEEDDIRVPVYLVTGFLESGKTSFVNGVLKQEYFQIAQPTVILNCETGEEEYDSAELSHYRAIVVDVDEKEELTEKLLQSIEDDLHPGRIMLELNPLWGVTEFRQMKLPEGWGVVQQIVTIDASTYGVYRQNMKSLFVEMFNEAELVMFNRCTSDMKLADFRRGIKVTSPACEVAFQDTEREMMDIFEDELPYDINADVLEIEDMDFGIFYVDLRDNMEKYAGKKAHFRGKVMKHRTMPPKMFGLGWMAMTCCADDVQFLGYIAQSPAVKNFANGSWAEVTCTIEIRHVMAYRGKGPVFTVHEMKEIEAPKSELVYFN